MPRSSIIRKTASDFRVPPNWVDYAETRAEFSWEKARQELAGLPGGGINIAFEAIERHAQGAWRDRVAMQFLGERQDRAITFLELSRLTNRFANLLNTLGVGKGDRLFVLSGRIPELYISVLGSLKNGTVACPLFSAFGPEPIATRLSLGDAKVLVTTAQLYRRKVEKIRDQLPGLQHVLLVHEHGEQAADIPGTVDLTRLMAESSDVFETVTTQAEDMALLHFTSAVGRKSEAPSAECNSLAHSAHARLPPQPRPGRDLLLHGQPPRTSPLPSDGTYRRFPQCRAPGTCTKSISHRCVGGSSRPHALCLDLAVLRRRLLRALESDQDRLREIFAKNRASVSRSCA